MSRSAAPAGLCLPALLTLLLLAGPAGLAAAAPARIDVASRVARVTVFQRGAQVVRAGAATLPAGPAELVFTGLPAGLDPASLRLRADGATVLSVTHRSNFLEDTPEAAETQRLRTRRQAVQDSLDVVRAMLEVAQQEEALLKANQSLGGTNTGVDVAELRQAADFFRTRLTEIKERQLALQRAAARLEATLAQLSGQIDELAAVGAQTATSEVVVAVTAPRAGRVALELTYLAPDAGWYPLYDLRVLTLSAPLTLAYNANVVQATGEDWSDVRLTLSTGDPAQPGTRPTLQPWRLGFDPPRRPGGFSRVVPGPPVRNPTRVLGRVVDAGTNAPLPGATVVVEGTPAGTATGADGRFALDVPPGARFLTFSFVGYAPARTPLVSNRFDVFLAPAALGLDEVVVTMSRKADAEAADAAAPPPGPTVEAVVNPTTVSFVIEEPYTIPSDGRPYQVAIRQSEVPAQYEHYAAPKLDPSAYLTARLVDWADLHLLGGEANLFFEGTYVGRTYLDVTSTADTLVVSLGRDPGVVVERKQQEAYVRRQLLGSRRVETRAYTLTVRNTRREAVVLVLEDQVPVSTTSAIEVRAEPDARATFEEATGILRWRLRLPPGAVETVGFSYTVRYPRDRSLVLE